VLDHGRGIDQLAMAAHTLPLTTGTIQVQNAYAPFVLLTGTMSGNVSLDFADVQGYWLVSTKGLNLNTHTLRFISGVGQATGIVTNMLYTVLVFGSGLISVTGTATL
jgi:hypothetical protein